MRVLAYQPESMTRWDDCVRQSRNGNFLHLRGFMDYHAARFQDASLLVLDDKDKVVAVLPANRRDDQIVSHGGLTYGGLLMTERVTQAQCLQAFDLIAQHYRAQGMARITYKAIPHIFHACASEEDLYALFRHGARLVRRDACSAIALQEPFSYSKGRKWSVNKARKSGLDLGIASDPAAFHELLASVLLRHGAQPVHTLEELRLLMQRFPQQIVLHECRQAGMLLAGALVFDFGRTVHTQYLAASEAGRELFALDLVLADLIENTYATRHWLSFGASTEQAGRVLNEGLIGQKEGYGARGIAQDFYEWNLSA